MPTLVLYLFRFRDPSPPSGFARPGGEHHRSLAHLGCAFWEREPGADDDLPMSWRSRVCVAPALLLAC